MLVCLVVIGIHIEIRAVLQGHLTLEIDNVEEDMILILQGMTIIMIMTSRSMHHHTPSGSSVYYSESPDRSYRSRSRSRQCTP